MRWIAYAFTAFVIVVTSVSCSDNPILGEISITDVAEISEHVPVIRLETDKAGTSRFATVSLNNTGERTIAISRIVYSLPERFAILSTRIPGEIEPGDSALIEIVFHPQSHEESDSTETYHSSVQIFLDGRERPVEFVVFADE